MSLQNRNKKNQLPDSPKNILDKISLEKDYQKIYSLGCSLNRLQASYLVPVLKNHKQQHKILINLFNSTLKRNPFDSIPIFELLAKAGGESGYNLLKETFNTKKYGEGFELFALEALSRSPLKKVENELIRRLKQDPCAGIRMTAIKSLFIKRVTDLNDLLKACLMDEFDLNVATFAAIKLFALGEEIWLEQNLDSPDKLVSTASAVVLFHRNNPKAISIINSLKKFKASKEILLNLEIAKQVKKIKKSSVLYVIPKGTRIEILAQNEKGRYVSAAYEDTKEDTIYTQEQWVESNKKYHIFRDLEGGAAAGKYRLPAKTVMKEIILK